MGIQTRDYVYVQDVALINTLLLDYKENIILNVSCETETSVNDVFKEIINALQVDVTPNFGKPIAGEVMRSSCSNTKVQTIFSWSPSTTLQDGIKHTVSYFVSQRQ